MHRKRINVSTVLAGQRLGIKEVDEGIWIVSFTHTLDQPDLARRLVRVTHPRKAPGVLSSDEVGRLLNATTCLKHQAALSVA